MGFNLEGNLSRIKGCFLNNLIKSMKRRKKWTLVKSSHHCLNIQMKTGLSQKSNLRNLWILRKLTWANHHHWCLLHATKMILLSTLVNSLMKYWTLNSKSKVLSEDKRKREARSLNTYMITSKTCSFIVSIKQMIKRKGYIWGLNATILLFQALHILKTRAMNLFWLISNVMISKKLSLLL